MTIHKAALSDPESWVDAHGDYLYGYAMRRVRDADIAADLVQETLVAALQARDRYAGKSSEKTWLVGILKNKIIDFFRSRSREPLWEDFNTGDSIDREFKSSGPLRGSWKKGHRPEDWGENPSNAAERNELRLFLERCIDSLPFRFAQAFTMRELEFLPSEEICNALGLSPTNLRVLLHRTRKRLRRCLEDTWFADRKGST